MADEPRHDRTSEERENEQQSDDDQRREATTVAAQAPPRATRRAYWPQRRRLFHRIPKLSPAFRVRTYCDQEEQCDGTRLSEPARIRQSARDASRRVPP